MTAEKIAIFKRAVDLSKAVRNDEGIYPSEHGTLKVMTQNGQSCR